MNPTQTAPKGTKGSSMSWVHIVCNNYATKERKQTRGAGYKRRDLRAKG